MNESIKRTVVKTILYRVISILITIPFTGVTTAISLHLLLTAVYFIHERFWTHIDMK